MNSTQSGGHSSLGWWLRRGSENGGSVKWDEKVQGVPEKWDWVSKLQSTGKKSVFNINPGTVYTELPYTWIERWSDLDQ